MRGLSVCKLLRTSAKFEAKMATAAVTKKRKWTVLTLEMKLSIKKVLEKESSQRAVGESFGMPKSTVLSYGQI